MTDDKFRAIERAMCDVIQACRDALPAADDVLGHPRGSELTTAIADAASALMRAVGKEALEHGFLVHLSSGSSLEK